MLIEYKGMRPGVEHAAYIAENATLCGDVKLGKDSSVWFGAVIRADLAAVVVGDESNVQDNAVLHVDYDRPVMIGKRVSVGHGAVVHGAVIEDDVLIGMNATVLNGARIGRGSIVAAGALVKEGAVIPERSLVVGMPGKVVRTLDDAAVERTVRNAEIYVEEAREYARG